MENSPISQYALKLPWKDKDVPHALLDIIRGCNISCRACYNTVGERIKTLEEIRQELAVLCEHRRLDSIAIIGGEPTLHPQLCEIARMIKGHGISVEIFSNGLCAEPEMLGELREAGADMLFLHIDSHQNRPDLAAGFTPDDVRELREETAAKVAASGMGVGLSITAYADALSEIDEAVQFVLTSPHVDYLLVTLYRDVSTIEQVSGDIASGMNGELAVSSADYANDNLTNESIHTSLLDKFGIRPFAYLGSNVDGNDPRWLSYMAGAIIPKAETVNNIVSMPNDLSARKSNNVYWKTIKASVAERIFLGLHKRIKGRYPFYLEHSPGQFRFQLLANAIAGGHIGSNIALLVKSFKKGGSLRAKRLLFQCPAHLAEDGTIVHCAHCPDAIVQNGRLVPVCIADRFTTHSTE